MKTESPRSWPVTKHLKAEPRMDAHRPRRFRDQDLPSRDRVFFSKVLHHRRSTLRCKAATHSAVAGLSRLHTSVPGTSCQWVKLEGLGI